MSNSQTVVPIQSADLNRVKLRGLRLFVQMITDILVFQMGNCAVIGKTPVKYYLLLKSWASATFFVPHLIKLAKTH